MDTGKLGNSGAPLLLLEPAFELAGSYVRRPRATAASQTPLQQSELVSEFARSRLFELFLRFLDRLAQEQPVVLIIEDLHWADRSTLDLLVFLIRMPRHERLLVVATYRSDELHPKHQLQLALAELDRSRHLESIELRPFDREDLSLLLSGILGRPPSAATVQRIFAQSDGNAFLAEQLLAAEGSQPRQELPRRLQSMPACVLIGLRLAEMLVGRGSSKREREQ